MSILYTVHYEDVLIGQCDEKCYGASGTNCDCICGGLFHHMPFNVALRKLRKNKREIRKQFPEKNGWKVRFF